MLIYSSLAAEKMQIELCDVTGRVVRTDESRSQVGVNETKLDLSGLADGLYFYRIRNASEILFTGKLTVQGN